MQSTHFCTCWIHRPVQTCNRLKNVRGNQANCGRRYFRLSPCPKRCYLNWRQKHPFSPNPVVYTNIGIPSLQRFLKCYVSLFVFSVTVPNGKLRAFLVISSHVHVNVCLKWHQFDMIITKVLKMKPQFMKGINGNWNIGITNAHINKIFLTNFLSERTISCTRQSRQVLWVVLSAPFIKKIWKNDTI